MNPDNGAEFFSDAVVFSRRRRPADLTRTLSSEDSSRSFPKVVLRRTMNGMMGCFLTVSVLLFSSPVGALTDLTIPPSQSARTSAPRRDEPTPDVVFSHPQDISGLARLILSRGKRVDSVDHLL